jgi:hypothetical protein
MEPEYDLEDRLERQVQELVLLRESGVNLDGLFREWAMPQTQAMWESIPEYLTPPKSALERICADVLGEE